ncbi:hypothetical protein D1818_11020 [Aquimarina sp. BL5]|uniref:hypothetical protein n=1 Tax=Aquimarina sp. BL5 TaxID=1714860 RepID=UPI000E54D486|nr:hypothetical protein [Aquimarina sp. BL5]AXT51337.1 hypothetical protein D1818_11020 [Aquimarina sp. BL5]RKN09873.1 hypothetical protein D7036_03630 [Aquimarina sp. BL5]
MVLGTLSLFQKRGIFYKEQQLSSEDKFSKVIAQELVPDKGLKLLDTPEHQQLTLVDESGNTDYITAFYQDEGQATYPYEVTVWLLIEEAPEELL